jgi:hypothetical protein
MDFNLAAGLLSTDGRRTDERRIDAAAPATDVAAEGAGVGPVAGPKLDLEALLLDSLKTTSEMFRSNANTAPQPDAVRYAHTAARQHLRQHLF